MALTPDQIHTKLRLVGLTQPKRVRKEITALADILEPGEDIKGAASGIMDGKNWLVVCTDRRVLFLDKVIGGLLRKDIPLEMVSSVSMNTGMVFGSIDILGAGLSGMQVKNILKAEVPNLANAIQTARREHNE